MGRPKVPFPRPAEPANARPPVPDRGSLIRDLIHDCETAAALAPPPSGVLLDVQVESYRVVLIRVPPADAAVELSPREQEIARLVARGLPNKVIAHVLQISTWTVGTYLRRIYAKLAVSTRAAMVAKLADGRGAIGATD